MIDINYYKQAFVNRLKEQIIDKNINIKNLSKEIGISEKTLNIWINKKRFPNKKHLILLSKKLGLSTDYLLGLKDYQQFPS